MHCSKKPWRECQILASWCTSLATRKEIKPESAERFVPGLVNYSEIEELKCNVMTSESISFPLFHPHLNV